MQNLPLPAPSLTAQPFAVQQPVAQADNINPLNYLAPSALEPSALPPAQYSQQPAALARRPTQRFTMGPRADCEKCRLGVPGHWMHFD